ncbi:hypothetical protein BCR35DRAFT_146920 [Leucosporidium creatinivorum]|uniref:SnoaL-like domain-containing protein n=1 Tax=Leucosporidium creatinivorum TaxID=106004 RepID=A0A1Y2EPX8_9BASI|nr:hypothetical protein BCR35DRAFT_146920 [Leucosporidium creatinivorum]
MPALASSPPISPAESAIVQTPMEPHPVTPHKICGVEGFVHNLTEEEERWMARHNFTVDTSFKGDCLWADLWSEDGWAQMGNAPPVRGREAIRAFMRKSMAPIRFMRHNVVRTLAVREQGIIYQDSWLSFIVEGDTENKVITIPVSVTFHRAPNTTHMTGWQFYGDSAPWVSRWKAVNGLDGKGTKKKEGKL